MLPWLVGNAQLQHPIPDIGNTGLNPTNPSKISIPTSEIFILPLDLHSQLLPIATTTGGVDDDSWWRDKAGN